MAKKKTKPTPEQEIKQLREDIVREIEQWKILREYGCQDPFHSDGENMWLIRNHIIYDKNRLLELCGDGNLPEEYYLPTPPEVDRNYLAPKGEYFDRRKKSIERMPGDKVTTKKQADVDLRIGAFIVLR